LGRFFESPQVLVRPSYASKYPPGQAMFLALGQIVFGSPFYGVLIGNALMLFAICLMLYAWVRPQWALAVSAMVALCLSPHMYWTNSYWGGSVAAAGGALVLLGIGMYLKKQTKVAGVVFACGALLLFVTRPYEGGVVTLTALIVFGKELWSRRRAGVVVVALVIFLPGIIWTGIYNKAVTGSPFKLPHMEYGRQYMVTSEFSFLPLRPQPDNSHPRLAAMLGSQGFFVKDHYKPESPRWERILLGLGSVLWGLSLTPALLLTVLFPLAAREPTYRKMLIITAILLLALSVELFHSEHYSAPGWAVFALMIAVWAQRSWQWRLYGMPAGKVIVLLALALPPLVASFDAILPKSKGIDGLPEWPGWRVALVANLSKLQGDQLVFTRYPAQDWNVDEEWVYNLSDIDHEKVMFAHDLGTENRVLLNRYPGRTAWLVTFDPNTQKDHIEPYPATQ
jgi:hypothetical protein